MLWLLSSLLTRSRVGMLPLLRMLRMVPRVPLMLVCSFSREPSTSRSMSRFSILEPLLRPCRRFNLFCSYLFVCLVYLVNHAILMSPSAPSYLDIQYLVSINNRLRGRSGWSEGARPPRGRPPLLRRHKHRLVRGVGVGQGGGHGHRGHWRGFRH